MNWEQYLELSEKTLSTEFHSGAKVQNVLHAVMGICTEVEELFDNYLDTLDKTNVKEELGDIFWYLAILYREYNMEFSYISSKGHNPEDLVMKLNKDSLKMLDIMKKKLFYNKEVPTDELFELTSNVVSNTANLCNHYDILVEDCLQVNIDKLKARYGDKFTSERAINRDLKNERDILEG